MLRRCGFSLPLFCNRCAGSHFSKFSKDNDGVIRLEPGARATIAHTTFLNNEVGTDAPDTVAAGPVMGLYAGSDKQGAAAWFQDCEFGGSIADGPEEVAIANRYCRVYSTTALPTVWDRELGRQVSAWGLILDDVFDDTMGQPAVNAFEDVESDTGSAFLRPRDETFQRIVREESTSTLLQLFEIEYLPEGTEFNTSDPSGYPKSTPTNISLVAGLSASGVLSLLASLLAGWCFCFRKRSTNDTGGKVPPRAPTASGIPSALATNSHWATEVSATFMGTMCTPDVPPPEPDAPAAKKLEFLHTQLNGIAKDAVILERFTLLGPNQRRQGGAYPVLPVPAQRGCEREQWHSLPILGHGNPARLLRQWHN